MNNRDMENKIRDALGTNRDWTEEEIQAFRQQVREKMKQRNDGQPSPAPQRKKGTGLLRAAAITLAVAAALLIFPLAYSVLTPLPTGSADSTIRRTAIWINNQLHLGIQFSEPIEEEYTSDEGIEIILFNSLNDLKESSSLPIVFFETDELTIKTIESETNDKENISSTIMYISDNGYIRIIVTKTNNETISSIYSDDAFIIEKAIGDIHIWTSDSIRALLYFDGYEVQLFSSLPLEKFVNLLNYLRTLN